MSYGTGVGDLEARVRNLEQRAYSPELADLAARVAALEQGRFQQAGLGPQALPGDVWGWLAPGQTVSAASGTTLGSGTVTLADMASGSLTARTGTGSTVTVYNAGGGLAGGTVGYPVKLGVMADGSYSLDVAPCAAAV